MPRQQNIIKGYVNTPYGQVHYRSSPGPPTGTPLVLFHQTASSSVMYESLCAELGDDVWFFAPDTPGFGGTAAPPRTASIKYYADVLYASVRAMGIEKCWFFGHHTGASVAVQVAYDHPDLALKMALSGPPFLSEEEKAERRAAVHPIVVARDGSYLAATWERTWAKQPDMPEALAHRETVLNLHAGERYHEAYLAVFNHDFAGQLPQLRIPLLLMAGDLDTLWPHFDAACNAVPTAERAAFRGVGSLICDLRAKEVAETLRRFFFDGE